MGRNGIAPGAYVIRLTSPAYSADRFDLYAVIRAMKKILAHAMLAIVLAVLLFPLAWMFAI